MVNMAHHHGISLAVFVKYSWRFLIIYSGKGNTLTIINISYHFQLSVATRLLEIIEVTPNGTYQLGHHLGVRARTPRKVRQGLFLDLEVVLLPEAKIFSEFLWGQIGVRKTPLKMAF